MTETARNADGRFPKGVSGNPGGRSRVLRDLDTVLDEHRTPENVRETLSKLRGLALAGEPGAMKLYLERVLGPARDLGYTLTEDDLRDAPEAVLHWLAGR